MKNTITKQIPKGMGKNIANQKLVKKEEIQRKTMGREDFLSYQFSQIKCNCCTKKVPGFIVKYDVDGKITDQVPIHTACESCGMFLSHLEESAEFQGMCMDCFAEENVQ